MFFELIRMEKCNRLAGKAYAGIEIRPTAKIQMILGTNGSGKSTLMTLGFSPIAPSEKDFDKGGRWEVHISHKGSRYELSASFNEKNSYSFIKDGEEKNDGHTVTVQLELVKRYFNYTKELHDFFTLKTKFVPLGPQQRRDWIARLSEADFSFAFKEFNRFKKGLFGAQEVIKFLKRRINEEKEKLIDENDAEQMRARSKELHSLLGELMRIPKTDSHDTEYILQEEFDILLNSLGYAITRDYPRVPAAGEPSFEEQLNATGVERAVLSGELKAKGEYLAVAEQKLRRVEAMMSNDPKELEATLKELSDTLDTIPLSSINIHESLLVPCPRVVQAIRSQVADTPIDRVTAEELSIISEKLMTKRNTLAKANGLLDNIVSQIGHMENCQDVVCPACNTTFKPGVDPEVLNDLKDRRCKGEEFVRKVENEVNEIQDEFAEADSNYRAYKTLEEIRATYLKEAPGLFVFIDQCGGMAQGRGLFEKINIYEREVEYSLARKKIAERLEVVVAALAQYKEDFGNFDSIRLDFEHALGEYNALYEKNRKLLEHEIQLARWIKYAKEYDELHTRVEGDFDAFKERLIGLLHRQGDDLIAESIAKAQTTLAINETALAENELIQSIIKDLEIQLNEKLIEEEAYRKLVDAMSPKTGLIAEQISEQIGALVNGVNQMIERVWGYPLYIRVPDTDDVDLDYKFPMVVETVPRKDISEGSDSMLEIVNRAWAMTGYYSLDMVDYPLFLDEPGRTFDGAHQIKLIPLIKDLVDCGRFSQVVLISHQKDCQMAFPNSQVIILDDRNIDYPHPYNEHVEFLQ